MLLTYLLRLVLEQSGTHKFAIVFHVQFEFPLQAYSSFSDNEEEDVVQALFPQEYQSLLQVNLNS
jgi:hypothetical protein